MDLDDSHKQLTVIYQTSKTLNIISDTPSLPHVEQLAHKKLMLVTTKADQHQLRELIPPTTFHLLLNQLQPSSG